MAAYSVSAIAGQRLDEIFHYVRASWGDAQAEANIRGLFDCFDQIAGRQIVGRAIAADFEVDGNYHRHEHHFIYWKVLTTGSVGIVTILHERMHQMDRFKDDAGN